ncbi:MAG: hypothetical protein ACJ78Q_03720, partial [Chloroflexia bacterium]
APRLGMPMEHFRAFLAVARESPRKNGPTGEPGVVAEESQGPSVMNDPVDPERSQAEAEREPSLSAALRVAFGPPSTAAAWARPGVLEAIRDGYKLVFRDVLFTYAPK